MLRTLLTLTLTALFLLPAAAADNWHEDAFFGLHYDLHAGATDTELGRETTYEHIRAMLEKVNPDFVQYDCKGHPGYAGYPTEVGSPSPGIVNDALAIWRKVTRDMGIPLSIHYSGVWDTRAIELHPDWARRTPEGNPDKNNTCRLSGYDTELMIPQLLEVVKKYDVDGMWIDGENWASKPCWCERCTAAFTEKTGFTEVPKNPGNEHWFEWLQFHRDLFTQHVTNYTNAVHAADPECMVTSNWMYSVRQPEPMTAPIDWLSGDFDPSFGAERACAEARFLSSRGKPWDLMAWSFLRTGSEQWSFKTAPHLCQELAQVLGQGGAVFIYDTPQRSGRLTEWHQDILGEVAEFCRARQEYSFKTQTLPQVAILHSETTYYRHNDPLFNFGHGNQAVEGALHAVLENGYSADLLNEEILVERIRQYPVVIVPEREILPEKVMAALRSYVEQGGRLLMSGAQVSAQFPELTGTAPVEGAQHGGVYLPADEGAVTVGGAWQVVTLNGGEAVAGMLNQQDPNVNMLDAPSATRHRLGNGVVVAIHGPVFESYHAAHYPRLRRYIGDRIAELESPGLIHRQGPWFVEIAARQKDGKRLIQLINRATDGYTAPNRHMVEHVPDAGPFALSIPLVERPSRCYMAPEKDGLEWTWKDGVLTAQIGGLGIHNVLVIE